MLGFFKTKIRLLANNSSLVALRIIFINRKRAIALIVGILGKEIMPIIY